MNASVDTSPARFVIDDSKITRDLSKVKAKQDNLPAIKFLSCLGLTAICSAIGGYVGNVISDPSQGFLIAIGSSALVSAVYLGIHSLATKRRRFIFQSRQSCPS